VGDYHISPEGISLERFKHALETSEILPSRKILKQNIGENFRILAGLGIRNVKDLIGALRTKEKIEALSQKSGLPRDYLAILGRQARSYIPKPVYFRDIPGVDSEYVEKLASVGIKTTKHLFERGQFKAQRMELSRTTDIPTSYLLELTKLSDIARIGGLGPVFVRLFYETGAGTLKELSERTAEELSERLHAVNKAGGFSKVIPSPKDITSYIETAKELPKVIEYE